ncbi:paraquat-inducible protein A [Chitinimonas koreensis]|uniref:paraquat-inducible protein A n=1 Tax=Chitinimonas koreensis TaxID=356302 RepID=UPI0016547014|nr:paraquat-inducible protein A [Chitinimonas koreensis]QNM98427.1 paraquat-inducible protein A [Chitinimonas koreensis]
MSQPSPVAATCPPPARQLMACPDCDLLQQVRCDAGPQLQRCGRCGAELCNRSPGSIGRTLALLLTAVILFMIGNGFPIVGMELQGVRSAVSLPGAVLALWQQGEHAVAGAVLLTAIVAPGAMLAALLWLFLPLALGRAAPGARITLRLVHLLRPWGMIEVFLLGTLVAAVKLAGYASVHPGPALWSLAAMLPVLAAMFTSFRADDVWAALEQAPC